MSGKSESRPRARSGDEKVTEKTPDKPIKPLGPGDWLRALPWLFLFEFVYLLPYLSRAGGVAAKYVWDEHCVSHTYPVAWLAWEEVRSGFFPLWNQVSGCGLPLLANTLDETILPYSLVKYLFPFPLGLNLFIAVKILLALTGTFALARGIGSSRTGAIAAAAIYSFTGFIAININSVIAPVFVLPWCLFAMHRLAVRPRLSSFALVAVAYGLSLSGGNPQIPFIAVVLGFPLYLLSLRSRKKRFSFGDDLILPGAALSMGVIISLPQLLPFIEYLVGAFSHHLPGYGRLHLDPRGVVGVMSPLFAPAILLMSARTMPGSPEEFFARQFPPASYADATIPVPFEHLGMMAALFLVIALANLRRLPTAASYFAMVAVFCLGLAFGIFPFSLIAYLPPFDQISNWRFTTFPAALACSILAAMMITRLNSVSEKQLLVLLAGFSLLLVFGIALVVSRAGLPLTQLLIYGPAAGTIAIFLLIGAALLLRKPALVAALAFLELFAYDRALDRPLFPHPHQALKHPAAILACASPDPAFRFIAYDEVLHPSLGILLGRHDFRSYEMIFPRRQVEWIAAVNGFSRLESVIHYMTHYHFSLAPELLLSPAGDKAAISVALAHDFLPRAPWFNSEFPDARMLAPGPDYFQPAAATINGVSRHGFFQHAPSAVSINFYEHGPPRLAGYAALSPGAWDPKLGDGIQMALIRPAGPDSPAELLYARHLDPRGRDDEKRWTPFELGELHSTHLSAVVLPGPRDDPRSDFGLWTDFHDPLARAEFLAAWELVEPGEIKCYRRRDPQPRLRAARVVKVVPDFDECLALAAAHEPAAVVIDERGDDWADGAGEALGVEWGSNLIRARVEMESEGTLILADTYYPGWRAWLNGAEVRIHRADCAFRAIKAPAGRSLVEFRFLPVSFRIGLFGGIIGWASLFTLALLRKSGAASSPKG